MFFLPCQRYCMFLFQQEKKIGEFIHYTSIYLFKKVYLFIWWGKRTRGKGRERGRNLSRLCSEHGAYRGALSHNPEIRTSTETKNQKLKWLCHPGAPGLKKKKCWLRAALGRRWVTWRGCLRTGSRGTREVATACILWERWRCPSQAPLQAHSMSSRALFSCLGPYRWPKRILNRRDHL